MAQVHGNPEEIRTLAAAVHAFCDETGSNLRTLESQLHEMGSSTWSDSRYQKFAEELDQAATSIRRVLQVMDSDHIQYLEHVARVLEEYQQI